MRESVTFSTLGWAWCLSLVGAAGCSGGADVSMVTPVSVAPGGLGSLQLPLTAAAASGTTYHLRHAVFEVTNAFVFPPIALVVPGDGDTLKIDLPPSAFDFDYQVLLQDGWELDEVARDGTEHPISATLDSFNPISFTIKPERTTPVTYQFKAGSAVVTTGDGAVAVNVVVDDTLLDDFEDGDGHLAVLAGRNGTWFTFNDGTGVQTPAPDAELLPEVVDASANFVLHTRGQGFAPAAPLPDGTFAFGAGVGTNLSVDPLTDQAVPYDASGYTGIQFTFNMAFPPATPVQLTFLVATSATTPVDQGGTCTLGCFDDFAFVGSIPFSPFFFSGALPFEQLAQQGFGTPVAFDPSTIMSLKWIVAFPDLGQPASANSFDFQLDDVAFTSNAIPGAASSPIAVPVEVPPPPPVGILGSAGPGAWPLTSAPLAGVERAAAP